MSDRASGRVLLKLSGESLADPSSGAVLDASKLQRLSKEILAAHAKTEIAIVVGAGNIVRGAEVAGIGVERTVGDAMGMTATVINALAVSQSLVALGTRAPVFSAVPAAMPVRAFDAATCREALADQMVVVLAGGTGNPYFTTDTAAVLRAVELECSLLLKATRVDGVYSADPEKDPTAKRYENVTFEEVLEKRLRVMDQTAFALARDARLPIRVFDMTEPGHVQRALEGHALGTIVEER